MILADKIIRLRKRNGWSQEELAERLDVSRQAVSKWEGAQSLPDLDKLVRMSELFGVTTDELLKETVTDGDPSREAHGGEGTAQNRSAAEPDGTVGPQQTPKNGTDGTSKGGDPPKPPRRITREDAEEYLACRTRAAKRISAGTVLCIHSPLPLYLAIAVMARQGAVPYALSALLILLGLLGLFAIVGIGVSLLLYTCFRSGMEPSLNRGAFRIDGDAFRMAEDLRDRTRRSRARNLTAGILLCTLSPVPLLIVAFFGNAILLMAGLSLLHLLVALGVSGIIRTEMRWNGIVRLLKGERAEA